MFLHTHMHAAVQKHPWIHAWYTQYVITAQAGMQEGEHLFMHRAQARTGTRIFYIMHRGHNPEILLLCWSCWMTVKLCSVHPQQNPAPFNRLWIDHQGCNIGLKGLILLLLRQPSTRLPKTASIIIQMRQEVNKLEVKASAIGCCADPHWLLSVSVEEAASFTSFTVDGEVRL